MTDYALSGVKVLDLTHHIAGPYCTKLLASQGAEVIKVERPGSGDPSRAMGPFPGDQPDPEKSALYLYLNMGKKGVTLNLKSPEGVRLFKELVKDADALVENFSPRVMPSLGLSYETLREINPRLVMTSISNFGQTGPYRDYKAQDIVITAMGGLNYTTGDPQREPLKPGGSQGQYIAGTCAFTSTMLALYSSLAGGEGQYIDISMAELIAPHQELTTVSYAYGGQIHGRGLYRYIYGYPVDLYEAKDGLFVLNANGQGGNGLTMLALLVDKPELVDHPYLDRLNSMARINATFEEFDALFGDYFKTHTRLEIVEKAQELDMAFAPVQSMEDLLKDPQMEARNFFVELEHPKAGRLRYPGLPWVMSECPSYFARAPLLGEHNEEILGGRLGLSKDELAKLRQEGTI